ncbi:unnamed protein product [Adineta ricciae]|uniref:Transposase n=1 Tax=Adineta ricciae TaxID=249248 RepID=A0A813YNV6_ADIRI|nr:unnamed protein product [Adineta ricciae]
MLSVWWVVKGIIHWDILPIGCIVTVDLYCQQLDRVVAKLHGKQDRIYFPHDNARPHVAKLTHKKLLKLEWITLPHPSYSPDLAPTDYHFFRSLSNYLGEKKFDDENDLRAELANPVSSKHLVSYQR